MSTANGRGAIDRPPRIALLIDADNSPAAKFELILNELSTFGETSIRRAYGNWKKPGLRGWEELLHAMRSSRCSSSTIRAARTRATWPW